MCLTCFFFHTLYTLYQTCNTVLYNTGAPDSPAALRHDVSANTESSAVIQWQSPLYTGGSGISIISYMITANGQTTPVSSNEFTYTITGLDVNTNYSVEVISVNSCLESEPATVTVNIEAKG